MLKALSDFAQWLCPEPCPRCGSEAGSGFCASCHADFLRIESPCRNCGMPAPCDSCLTPDPEWHIDAVRAPFVYSPPLSQYLLALKFRGRRLLGRALGELLAVELASAHAPVDLLVAIPLHPHRLRTRRFNQSDEIAVGLSQQLGLPRLTRRIDRVVDTPPQTDLDRRARLGLASGVFRANLDLSGRRVAIVDDVITTGATANAMARALCTAGAAYIEAWAVARAARTGRPAGASTHSTRNR